MADDVIAVRLAALARAIADAAMPAAPDLGASDVAALLALSARDGLTVGEVASAADVSPSAAVRLVDRLERAWLVRRRRRVSREVLVDLTSRGRTRAQTLRDSGLAALTALVGTLDETERATLDRVVRRLATALSEAPAGFDVARFCRYCPRERCDCGLHGDPAAPVG
jgi:DNA-binding MarR family transcriptional regulator